MADDRRQIWQERYLQGRQQPPQACALLRDHHHLLPSRADALDLACGRGGNALLLAQAGLNTTAWDYAASAIEQLQQDSCGLPLHAEVRDVLARPPAASTFDVIVVSYFLERSLCPILIEALRPNGLLLYETFSQLAVSDRGPDKCDYRLASGELLHLFSGLELVFYRQEGRLGNTGQGTRDIAQFIGHKAHQS